MQNQKRIMSLKKYLHPSLVPYAVKNYSHRMLTKLKRGFLLSKILEEKYFWKSLFKTTNNTLDPRSDTETLLEVFLQQYNKYYESKEKMTLMDMCCGTGAIGISLLMEKENFHGLFMDISHKALQVCKHNIRKHKLWHKSKIIKKSLTHMKDRPIDFLVSNPPYLLLEEIKANHVLIQDPFISLYGGKDGLFFYYLLSLYIKKNVKYFACIEIDHYRKDQILKIFQLCNFQEIEIFKDINGLDRVLYCRSENKDYYQRP